MMRTIFGRLAAALATIARPKAAVKKCLRAPIALELVSMVVDTKGEDQEDVAGKTYVNGSYFTVVLKGLRGTHIHLPLHPRCSLWREGRFT